MKLYHYEFTYRKNLFFIFLLSFLIVNSCARAPLLVREKAVRLISDSPILEDHLSLESFHDAIKKTLLAFDGSNPSIPENFEFEARKISKAEYRMALKKVLENASTLAELSAFLKQNFDFYEVYGSDSWGKVLVTGYYSPLLSGSKIPEGKQVQPLYQPPKEMVTVDLSAFVARMPALQAVANENQGKWPTVRGILKPGKNGSATVVPVFDRAEIDLAGGKSALAGKGLEIAYVDPIDAFFLQIQGSGTVLFPDGSRKRLGYAAQNGAAYAPIGKFLKGVIPPEKMSMQSIRAHLLSLPPSEVQLLMNQNPSYVFFKELNSEPVTFSGAETTAGRTIATDKKLFPKGVLAYLEVATPVFDGVNFSDPVSFEPKGRLVLDQDTGGAIIGGGHVDLYFGEGELAAASAGVMKNPGRLWFLVPKLAFLSAFPQEHTQN